MAISLIVAAALLAQSLHRLEGPPILLPPVALTLHLTKTERVSEVPPRH
jgi:hypothetical protein